MADNLMVSYAYTTSTKFALLTEKRSSTLYFLTDTKELYKGDIPFTEAAVMVTELPLTSAGKGKILIKPDFSGYVWSDAESKWVQVLGAVSETLNDTDDFTGKLVSGKAVKDYIASKIDSEIAAGNINTDNVKISEDITIIGQSLGGYTEGTVIPTGTLLTDYIKGISMKRIAATYVAPTIEIGTSVVTVEAGSLVSPVINPVFTQNDAGNLTAYKLEKSANSTITTLEDVAAITSHTDADITIGDGSSVVAYITTASYAEGIIKNDNLGDPSPTGHIVAGNVTDTLTYDGVRKGFSANEAGPTIACTTSAEVRGLTATAGTVTEGNARFVLNCKTGDTRVTFAYPATIKDFTSVVSKALGYNVGGNFEKTTVQVEGANGYTAIDYKVFTYIPAVPFPTDDTYTVNI
jgi:hypothetical protein